MLEKKFVFAGLSKILRHHQKRTVGPLWFYHETARFDDIRNETKNYSYHWRCRVQSWQSYVRRNQEVFFGYMFLKSKNCTLQKNSNWFFFLILRLSILVDEFNDPFHPDTLVLNVYKSRLNHHIGKKHALIDKIN